MNTTIPVAGLTNHEFFARYARAGRIGVIGGTDWTNRMISRAQRLQNEDRQWSAWSHAFLCEGRRADGHHWVIESDMEIKPSHIRLGVQENRIAKYCDDELYGTAAVIDLGLDAAQERKLLAHALEHVAAGMRYSVAEIVGTAWALRHPRWRPKENLLARDRSFYCSAFVRHTFSQIGLELATGIAVKHTTPEDIAQTMLPHKKWVMIRTEPGSKLRKFIRELRVARARRRSAKQM